MTGACFGASYATRISVQRLERLIVVLLVAIGCLLVVEGLLPWKSIGIPFGLPVRLPVAVGLGVGIGVVSSLLGVAGRELIIPTLVFVFGADIKIAGTVSITISLPTAAVGIARYATRGAYHSRADLGSLVAPMGLGSILGALLGGALVPYAPAGLLKIGLGAILVVSAVRIFRHANPRD